MDKSDNKVRRPRSRLQIAFKGNMWIGGERSRPKSRRKRCRGRQFKTYQNKLRKLQSNYNKLFKVSQKSKGHFQSLLEEEQQKILKSKRQTIESHKKKEPKEFFCDKYPTFESFIAVNKLAKPETHTEKPKSYSSRSKIRKSGLWGY